MDKSAYVYMVYRLLRDQSTYEIIESNPPEQYLKELKEILLQAKSDRLITEEEFKILFNPTTTLATFFCLT